MKSLAQLRMQRKVLAYKVLESQRNGLIDYPRAKSLLQRINQAYQITRLKLLVK